MVVEGAEADVGLVGDLVDARVVHALAREQRPRRFHEPGASSFAPTGVTVGRGGARHAWDASGHPEANRAGSRLMPWRVLLSRRSGTPVLDLRHTRDHRPQQRLHLELGEVYADARVRPVAPAELDLVRAMQVEALGFGELGLVQVGGSEEQDDPGAARHCNLPYHVVLRELPGESRIGEARRTFSTTARGISARVLADLPPRVGVPASTHSRYVEARIVVSRAGATKSMHIALASVGAHLAAVASLEHRAAQLSGLT